MCWNLKRVQQDAEIYGIILDLSGVCEINEWMLCATGSNSRNQSQLSSNTETMKATWNMPNKKTRITTMIIIINNNRCRSDKPVWQTQTDGNRSVTVHTKATNDRWLLTFLLQDPNAKHLQRCEPCLSVLCLSSSVFSFRYYVARASILSLPS
jgi:hypothetical protein